MTDRDRLIELLSATHTETDNYKEQARLHDEYIADYLLANGVIVPPCKVGDIVYAYEHKWRKDSDIVPYQITNITITQNKKGVWTKKYRAMQVIDGKTIDWQINFAFEEIGKTVFLTKEEAEQKLKELKK